MKKQEIRQDLIKQLRSILEEVDQLEVSKDSERWKDSACNHLHEVTDYIAYQFGLCSECLTPTPKRTLREFDRLCYHCSKG